MEKSYYRLMFGIYGGALLICGVLRIYLKLFGIDAQTGFYTAGGLPVMLFNLVLAAALITMLVLNRLRITDHDYPILREGHISSFFSLWTGVSILLFTLEAARIKPLTAHSGIGLAGPAAKVCALLGILSALSFLWLGLRGILRGSGEPNGILVLIPALWKMVLIVTKFNSYPTLTTISDNLLAILFMVACVMFIVGHARTLCGFARKDGHNYLIPAGLATSLCGLLLTVPNVLYMAVRHTGIPAQSLGDMECMYIFVMSVYALVTVLEMRKSIAAV